MHYLQTSEVVAASGHFFGFFSGEGDEHQAAASEACERLANYLPLGHSYCLSLSLAVSRSNIACCGY